MWRLGSKIQVFVVGKSAQIYAATVDYSGALDIKVDGKGVEGMGWRDDVQRSSFDSFNKNRALEAESRGLSLSTAPLPKPSRFPFFQKCHRVSCMLKLKVIEVVKRKGAMVDIFINVYPLIVKTL